MHHTLRTVVVVLLAALAARVEAGQIDRVTGPIHCEGRYAHHLQGVCTDGDDAIYWCFTTQLVKTDLQGRVQKQIEVATHHGDLCYHDGQIYVALNLGKFNDADGGGDSWIYVYDARDLSLLAKHPTPEVFHGAGGIAFRDGRFIVVGGLPSDIEENYVYEYDEQCHFVKKHVLQSRQTLKGIQTAAFADDRWWFGCYGKPATLLTADASLANVERFEFDASLGIVPLSSGKFLIGRNAKSAEGYAGSLILAVADAKRGLVLVGEPK